MTKQMDMAGMPMNMDMRPHGHGALRPMSHHMVVFGHDAVFMSHLAMFSVPEHAFQVILETQMSGADDPMAVYRQDRAKHPEVLFYTFEPDPFVLSDLLPTATGAPPTATTFTGNLWRNHLEQPQTHPTQIASAVTVTVTNIICGRPLHASTPRPAHLQYVLFGRGDDVFLAHMISRPPDFDQLMPVSVSPTLSDDDLSRGHTVTVGAAPDTEGGRLQPSGQPVTATADTGTPAISLQLTAGAALYFNDDSDMGGKDE